MYRECVENQLIQNSFLFARDTGKESFSAGFMKFSEDICFYLTRSRNNIFVNVPTNVFGIGGGRLVLGLFYISTL